MADGTTKPIEQIKAGDVVESADPATGKISPQTVLYSVQFNAHRVVTLTFTDPNEAGIDDTVTASPEHPFFVAGRGFVATGGLRDGDRVVDGDGGTLTVSSIEWHQRKEGYPVYNFEVSGTHTYFVGNADGGLWVHNPPGCPGGFRQLDASHEALQ